MVFRLRKNYTQLSLLFFQWGYLLMYLWEIEIAFA